MKDKDSVEFFMTEMTQSEFEERFKGYESVPYKFNMIKEPVLKPTDPPSRASNAVKPREDRLKQNHGPECANPKCRCMERKKALEKNTETSYSPKIEEKNA